MHRHFMRHRRYPRRKALKSAKKTKRKETPENFYKLFDLTVDTKTPSITLNGSKFSSTKIERLTPIVKCALETGEVGKFQLKINKSNRVIRERVMDILLEETEKTFMKLFPQKAYPTNWNDLSEKLKRKCIDMMSFKTQIRLRMTSKTEKAILDSHRFAFDYLKIEKLEESETIELSLLTPRQNVFLRFENASKFIAEGLDLFTFLLKTGTFQILDLEIDDEFMEESLARVDFKIRFRKYYNFVSTFPQGAQFLLENCEQKVKAVYFDPKNSDEEDLEKLMQLPAVFNAYRVVIWHIHHPLAALTLLEKWIEIDAKLGATFDFEALTKETVEALDTKFGDRIKYRHETEGEIRINTDNPEKLIAIKYAPFFDSTFRCTVVSSTHPQLEFYKVHDGSSSDEESGKNDYEKWKPDIVPEEEEDYDECGDEEDEIYVPRSQDVSDEEEEYDENDKYEGLEEHEVLDEYEGLVEYEYHPDPEYGGIWRRIDKNGGNGENGGDEEEGREEEEAVEE